MTSGREVWEGYFRNLGLAFGCNRATWWVCWARMSVVGWGNEWVEHGAGGGAIKSQSAKISGARIVHLLVYCERYNLPAEVCLDTAIVWVRCHVVTNAAISGSCCKSYRPPPTHYRLSVCTSLDGILATKVRHRLYTLSNVYI